MQLTPNQQTMIQRHLRGVALSLNPEMPETRKLSLVQQEKQRIYQCLNNLGKTTVSDGDVAGALEALLDPDKAKRSTHPSVDPEAKLILVMEKRVWLGVCGGLAARLRLERWVLRSLFALLGLLTGPVALILYMGLYLKMHVSTPQDMRPEFLWGRFAVRTVIAVVAVYLMHYGVMLAIDLIFYANEQFLTRYGYDLTSVLAEPDLGKWDWLRERGAELRRWALFLIVPTAAISGLALSNDWDHSMKRVAQALAAIYGIVLCFGVASLLVGLILEVIEAIGVDLSAMLPPILQ